MTLLTAVIAVLIISSLLCLIRLVIGPTAPDRVISVDALTSLTIGILAIIGLRYSSIFLDVALVYAFIAFLGGVAVSKYLEGRDLGE